MLKRKSGGPSCEESLDKWLQCSLSVMARALEDSVRVARDNDRRLHLLKNIVALVRADRIRSTQDTDFFPRFDVYMICVYAILNEMTGNRSLAHLLQRGKTVHFPSAEFEDLCRIIACIPTTESIKPDTIKSQLGAAWDQYLSRTLAADAMPHFTGRKGVDAVVLAFLVEIAETHTTRDIFQRLSAVPAPRDEVDSLFSGGEAAAAEASTAYTLDGVSWEMLDDEQEQHLVDFVAALDGVQWEMLEGDEDDAQCSVDSAATMKGRAQGGLDDIVESEEGEPDSYSVRSGWSFA